MTKVWFDQAGAWLFDEDGFFIDSLDQSACYRGRLYYQSYGYSGTLRVELPAALKELER